MTVRYTAIEGMQEPALRDVDHNAERWRDKIELRLDNRQVFFLFFGSAVVACMLFVLGVMVGKRIESRGQAAAPELQDPLAALDRAHKPAAGVAAPAPQLTFPNTLIAPPAKPKSAKLAVVAPGAAAPGAERGGGGARGEAGRGGARGEAGGGGTRGEAGAGGCGEARAGAGPATAEADR